MTYQFTQAENVAVTPKVAIVTKSTSTNINKLKVYLSNETGDRQNTK